MYDIILAVGGGRVIIYELSKVKGQKELDLQWLKSYILSCLSCVLQLVVRLNRFHDVEVKWSATELRMMQDDLYWMDTTHYIVTAWSDIW